MQAHAEVSRFHGHAAPLGHIAAVVAAAFEAYEPWQYIFGEVQSVGSRALVALVGLLHLGSLDWC